MNTSNTSCPFTLPPDYEVLGAKPIIDSGGSGGYQKWDIYVRGVKPKPPSCLSSQIVEGWQGRETRIRLEGIIPIRVFDVKP